MDEGEPAGRRVRLAPVLIVAALFAGLAAYVVPRGIAARETLAIAGDPVRIADRALDKTFNAAVAEREIKAALAANDADLARSFVELADARHVPLDPALAAKVDAATAEASSTRHTLVSFARGFVTGIPDDGAALAGTALGDLFVFGDIRDAAREGTHWALGEPTDKLILGLACVGLAITAGTYVTAGLTEPARLGLTLAKAARKTGALGGGLAVALGRMLRQAVDWSRLRRAIPGLSVAEPAAAVRAAGEAVKVERAGRLVQLAGDVGRIERKAGARAALESLKLAETPAEVSRVAKLAAKEGGKTRAIIKLLGRGAIMLTVGSFNLGLWILGALFTLFGFVTSLKATTERMALRVVRHRKDRRRRRELQRFAALTAARL
ncbi:MAG TPA: hypothetical protein VE224_16760 [Pseudolabrys sp.]|nr:hypothetical protein [Pseudolabrys sp.]